MNTWPVSRVNLGRAENAVMRYRGERWIWCILLCNNLVLWKDRWNELTDNEQILLRSFSRALTASYVSMAIYMSCWHKAHYEGGTASCLLLCTASAKEVRYAQLMRFRETGYCRGWTHCICLLTKFHQTFYFDKLCLKWLTPQTACYDVYN